MKEKKGQNAENSEAVLMPFELLSKLRESDLKLKNLQLQIELERKDQSDAIKTFAYENGLKPTQISEINLDTGMITFTKGKQ